MMKLTLSTILLLLLSVAFVKAQDAPFHLVCEGDKNTVKLLWYVDSWQDGVSGFMVKRRTVSSSGRTGKWVEVNKTVIFPELSTSKDLNNLGLDEDQVKSIKDKLTHYISGTNKQATLKTFTMQQFLDRAKADPTASRAIHIAFSTDYDIALLSGFAVIDNNIPSADSYEYGLFPVIDEKTSKEEVATCKWKYGTSPDLSLPIEATAKYTEKKTKVQIVWKVETKKYKDLNINGFNVYRQISGEKMIKLNITPIWLSSVKEIADVSFYDNSAKEGTVYTYSVAPLSLFNTEGPKANAIYDPARAVHAFTAPALKDFNLSVYAAAPPEVVVSWEFKKYEEDYIKGFIVERADKGDDFKPVSEMLPPSTRTYGERSAKSINGYYAFRVSVVTDDPDYKAWSNVVLYFYNPKIKPPTPKNLTCKHIPEKGHQYVMLNWDAKAADDTLTDGYHIYSNFPPYEKMMMDASIPLIKNNQYKFEVFNSVAARYKFQVSAQSKYKHEGDPCKAVDVLSPTRIMPFPNLWPIKVDSNRIILEWRYENIPDLKGFLVYQDKKVIVNEKTLTKDSRKWISPPMEYGREYVFEVAAVSDYGVISGMSFERKIRILKKAKK